jgi:hypothetical protein
MRKAGKEEGELIRKAEMQEVRKGARAPLPA